MGKAMNHQETNETSPNSKIKKHSREVRWKRSRFIYYMIFFYLNHLLSNKLSNILEKANGFLMDDQSLD